MTNQILYTRIPSIDVLLQQPSLESYMKKYSPNIVKSALQKGAQHIRIRIPDMNPDTSRENLMNQILLFAIKSLETLHRPNMHTVINATGVILHTGLGRAPLSQAAQENVRQIMSGYCNLEIDLETGKRGERNDHIAPLIRQLTGAQDAVMVNNNAAAVFLSLNTLAFGKEAIISRGELIEIGGAFRMPDIMQQSGTIMREVGTTNKTKLSDYEQAINENTGCIVVAHTSNYRVQGFTAEVEIEALARMAKQHSIPILHDLGGGVITDLQEWGLPYEPLVQDSLTAGVQVVTFSGDKVLGGPQAGIIAGEKEWIRRIHTNPIMRAVRCDKLVFSAMEATLKLFLNPDQLLQNNKALQFLTDSVDLVKKKAQAVFDSLENRTGVTIEPCFSQTGSGALPLEKIDSFGLFIQHSDLENLHKRLRLGDPAVMGHIQNNKLILDMRTVDETQLLSLIERLNELLPMV